MGLQEEVVPDLTARLRKHVTFWFVKSKRKSAAIIFPARLGDSGTLLPVGKFLQLAEIQRF
jgi:hypothetical protein